MKKIFIALSLSTFVFFCLSFTTPNTARANTGSGWEFFGAEYWGKAVGCAPEQAKKDFILVGYTSDTPITDIGGLALKTQVIRRAGGFKVERESAWAVGTNTSPAICYDPTKESVRLVVKTDSSANYHPYAGAAWWPIDTDARIEDIGTFQRSYAHMQPKSMAPTIELKSPVNTFVNTNRPAIVVDTNDISTLYNANSLATTYIGFWKNGLRNKRYSFDHRRAGVGERAFIPDTLTDGIHTVTVTQQLNGSSNPINKVPNTKYRREWYLISEGTLTIPVDFYVDSTLPTASVTMTGSSTAVESRVNAVVTVRDAGSGMRSFNLVLIPTRTPGNTASVTVPFTVGTGLIGGPKDAQTVRMSLRVLPGTDYQYYVVATDVAGNRYQTPRQTLRTDNVYPDLDASNFRIISTCLPEDVGGDMSAICPLTRADVRMNNVGGREIPNGTRVSYRIESQPTGGSWTSVATGNYTAGLQPGVLSTAIPLTLTNLRGGSRLRLVVNLAPQLNSAIGEQNFANNTSAPLNLVFTQAPPRLLLEVDRSLVRRNDTVTIHWEIESPYGVECRLQDGGSVRTISHASGITSGNMISEPLENSRKITITCTSSAGVETTASVDVSVVPTIQEV